jgi:CelD/BcsL family acetyltransferase involved in cellulose biosynthesis
MQSFGELSYFSDARFRSSYEQLVKWLSDHDFLRITTVLLGGRVAAVDIGTVWGREYTVLAGATDLEFQGVAKVINLHHMQWACRQRLNTLDFLCGDFGWKKRFHLTPRPLYEIYRNCAAKSPAISESRLSRVKVREH